MVAKSIWIQDKKQVGGVIHKGNAKTVHYSTWSQSLHVYIPGLI